jgi:hypothetical protein
MVVTMKLEDIINEFSSEDINPDRKNEFRPPEFNNSNNHYKDNNYLH